MKSLNCCEDYHAHKAQIGKPAPGFIADAVIDGGQFTKVDLNDYKGKWVVLFFYPLDFTFICPTEITGFSKHMEDFKALNAEVIGGSTDSIHSHKAWLEKDLGDLHFPLISDNNHQISQDYGILIEEEGITHRATCIIDPDGVLQYYLVNSNNVGRSVKETLRVLKALQTGDLCPVDWEEGGETLGKA